MSRPAAVALLFPGGAEEAIRFYRDVFPDAEIVLEQRAPDGAHIATSLKIRGTEFLLISGGPECAFSMATSFMLFCDTQEEIDTYWARLGDGGTEHACGWLTDRFGVTWQVTPSRYAEWMTTGTPAQAEAAFQMLISQTKIDIAAIEAAWLAAG